MPRWLRRPGRQTVPELPRVCWSCEWRAWCPPFTERRNFCSQAQHSLQWFAEASRPHQHCAVISRGPLLSVEATASLSVSGRKRTAASRCRIQAGSRHVAPHVILRHKASSNSDDVRLSAELHEAAALIECWGSTVPSETIARREWTGVSQRFSIWCGAGLVDCDANPR